MDQGAVARMEAEARRDLAKAHAQDNALDSLYNEQVNKVFNDYDKSKTGFITTADFRDAIDDMMVWDPVLYPKVFKKMDTSGDGQLNRSELAEGLEMINAAKIFDGMDADNTGLLSKGEWMTVCMKMNFNQDDAQGVFEDFDVSGDEVMNFEEFLDAMKEMHGMFMMNDIQTRIEMTKQEIQRVEKRVEELLKGVDFHNDKLSSARSKKSAHQEKRDAHQKLVDEHLAFFGTKESMVKGHREHLDVLSMSLSELQEKFKEYKSDLHKAYKNKQWEVCKELSDELVQIKWELDDQQGRHDELRVTHDTNHSAVEDKKVSHRQADIELKHLHDMLMEAEAHHDEIEAAHGGHMAELRQCEVKYEELKQRLMELEEQGARGGLGLVMKKLDKIIDAVKEVNAKILGKCQRFDILFKTKQFKEISILGMELNGLQKQADKVEGERDRLLAVTKSKKREMDMIDKREQADAKRVGTGSARDRAAQEFAR